MSDFLPRDWVKLARERIAEDDRCAEALLTYLESSSEPIPRWDGRPDDLRCENPAKREVCKSTESHMSPSVSPRQAQLLAILSDYDEPQPAAVLARIMRYKHGDKSPSVTYDLLGALERKGLAVLGPKGWALVHGEDR